MAKEAGYFPQSKIALRDQVHQLEADFLARGGTIQHLKNGQSSVKLSNKGWRTLAQGEDLPTAAADKAALAKEAKAAEKKAA